MHFVIIIILQATSTVYTIQQTLYYNVQLQESKIIKIMCVRNAFFLFLFTFHLSFHLSIENITIIANAICIRVSQEVSSHRNDDSEQYFRVLELWFTLNSLFYLFWCHSLNIYIFFYSHICAWKSIKWILWIVLYGFACLFR